MERRYRLVFRLGIWRYDVGAEPGFELRKCEPTLGVEGNQESIGSFVIKIESVAIHAKEGSADGDSDPLVPVNEWVVLRKALPERCGFRIRSR